MGRSFAPAAIRHLAALGLLCASGMSAAANGIWSGNGSFTECTLLGRLVYDDEYYSMSLSLDEDMQALRFVIGDYSTTGPRRRLFVESPSLAKPLRVDGDFVTGPQLEAFRADVARGAAWRLVAQPPGGEPRILDAPPSNSRTWMAMFDACVATNSQTTNVTATMKFTPGNWHVDGEASACTARVVPDFAVDALEVRMEARRDELGIAASIRDPALAATLSIDLGDLGGPRSPPGETARFALDRQQRAQLLRKFAGAEAVVVRVKEASGDSRRVPLVAPQDAVAVAMFRACVGALESTPPP